MLEENQIKKYWHKRSEEQGEKTVGFNNDPITKQNYRYAKRMDFIFQHVPTNLKTLDYGCGIGRYAPKFPFYIGMDITYNLVTIAKDNNPDKRFVVIPSPCIPDDVSMKHTELFFTATVLQHCSDEVVRNILSNLPDVSMIALYENNHVKESKHVKGRTTREYWELLPKNLRKDIRRRESYSHVIHGERHTLSIFYVK